MGGRFSCIWVPGKHKISQTGQLGSRIKHIKIFACSVLDTNVAMFLHLLSSLLVGKQCCESGLLFEVMAKPL